MHPYSWIALLMAISSVANCISILDGTSQEYQTHRDGKRLNGLSSRQIRVPCNAVTEDYEGGDITIMGNGGIFYSPKQPIEGRKMSNKRNRQRQRQRQRQPPKEHTYRAELCPGEYVVQIKVQVDMVMKGPTRGKCTDKLKIKGAKKEFMIPELCGTVNNQILYIDIDNNTGPYEIIVTSLKYSEEKEFSSETYERTIVPYWNISINFLDEDDIDFVPDGCLQYQRTPTGTLQSFNFGGQAMKDKSYMALINQRYSICFAYIVGYCDILFNFTRFDVGKAEANCKDDYLLIGDDKHCGDEINKIVKVDASDPIYVNVRMDNNNDDQEEGFSGTYRMMPCGSKGSTTFFEPSTMTFKAPISTSTPSTSTSNSLDFFWL